MSRTGIDCFYVYNAVVSLVQTIAQRTYQSIVFDHHFKLFQVGALAEVRQRDQAEEGPAHA